MKTINQVFTYGEIYNISIKFIENFSNINDIYLSAAVAFSIQKNKQQFLAIADEIENSRINIINKYSPNIINSDNTQIQIPQENVEKANKELLELLNIKEEIKIYTFSIEELEDVKFTPLQMEAIMFMIKD